MKEDWKSLQQATRALREDPVVFWGKGWWRIVAYVIGFLFALVGAFIRLWIDN